MWTEIIRQCVSGDSTRHRLDKSTLSPPTQCQCRLADSVIGGVNCEREEEEESALLYR